MRNAERALTLIEDILNDTSGAIELPGVVFVSGEFAHFVCLTSQLPGYLCASG